MTEPAKPRELPPFPEKPSRENDWANDFPDLDNFGPSLRFDRDGKPIAPHMPPAPRTK